MSGADWLHLAVVFVLNMASYALGFRFGAQWQREKDKH